MKTLKEKLDFNSIDGREEFKNYLKYQIDNQDWLSKSQSFAATVIQHLIKNKMFQIELAEKLNISSIELSKLLSGKHDFTLSEISKIEKVLETKLSAFGIEYTNPSWHKKIYKHEKENDKD